MKHFYNYNLIVHLDVAQYISFVTSSRNSTRRKRQELAPLEMALAEVIIIYEDCIL